MRREELIDQFTKSLVKKVRRNEISPSQITSTLITAALSLSFVNEACKSSGQISKSQVVYRKLNGKSLWEIEKCFQEITVRFLKVLKAYSRNRFFLISLLAQSNEAFYGDVSKAEDKLYLHHGSIAKGSDYYYKYLTVSITCNVTAKYILDGILVPCGCYVEDYVYETTGICHGTSTY